MRSIFPTHETLCFVTCGSMERAISVHNFLTLAVSLPVKTCSFTSMVTQVLLYNIEITSDSWIMS